MNTSGISFPRALVSRAMAKPQSKRRKSQKAGQQQEDSSCESEGPAECSSDSEGSVCQDAALVSPP